MTCIKLIGGIFPLYCEALKMIFNINSTGIWYVIDIDTGYKVEFSIIREEAYCWKDKIRKDDIRRARADKIDISRLQFDSSKYSGKEENDIREKIEVFLKSQYVPFTIREVKYYYI